MKIQRLSAALGAEVTEMLLRDVGPEEAKQIHALLIEHQVLFFPGQFMNPEEHIKFGRHFGPIEGHPHLSNLEKHPEIFHLAASGGGVADEWHSDITFQEHPSVMAILNMIQCPEIGGDTMWSNAYLAYEALSIPLQELCSGLTALHDARSHGKPEKMAVHPVIRIHPVTKKRALFVNEHFTRRIVELSHQESELLLGYLTKWVAQSHFTLRHKWTNGTVAMWDNRCTQHFVLNDFTEERVIERVTVCGDSPEGVAAPRWSPYARTQHAGSSSHHDRQLRAYLRSKE